MERISKILEIDAPVAAVYEAWKHVENFPRVLGSIEQVVRVPREASNWSARIFGKRLHWQALVTEDIPDTRIRWTSVGGNVSHRGLVEIIPAQGCSVALVVIEYKPPLGLLGRLAGFFLDIEGRLESELQRLKAYIEQEQLPEASRRRSILRRRNRGQALAPVN